MNAIISLCFGGDPERRARTSITTDWLPPQTHTHTNTRALCWKSFAPVFAVTPIAVLTWNGRGPEDVSLRCVLHSSPLHTCTAISRLINCESCSLETLNHSFSVLSRAGSLTTLTKVPPCLPNTAHSGAEVRIEKVRIELVWSGTARRVGVQIWTTTTCRKKMSVNNLQPREGKHPLVSLQTSHCSFSYLCDCRLWFFLPRET